MRLWTARLTSLVKRAFRALNSDAYKKARSKNSVLPEVSNEEQARTTLQLLPLNVLALRVIKKDPHEGHDHPKKKEKRIKGLWTVQIHGHQEFDPTMHYMWLYEGSQWKQKVWAALAVLLVFTVVLFPLWPLMMRQGVWYLSVGAMGLLAAFFAMAIFRLILFCVTVFTTPPGLWLFPNLFEDVGFVDSFKPLWGWQETKKAKKKSKKIEAGVGAENPPSAGQVAPANNGSATATAVEAAIEGSVVKRHAAPTVEEVDDD
jgi:translocation protein SEC62